VIDASDGSSVAHQAAGQRKLTETVDCRNAVARRQRDQLIDPRIDERIGLDNQRGDFLLVERGERRVKSPSRQLPSAV